MRRADLAAHRTLIEEPVAVDYRGYQVYKCGPWTQGPYLCQALRLLEGFDLKGMGHCSADYVHAVVEAMKLAMADRDAHYGDPLFVDVPMNALLSDEYTQLRQPLIDMGASCAGRPTRRPARHEGCCRRAAAFRPGVGGTTTCVVADRWGMVVSATPSANVYHAGGTGSTGVSYGNRLRSLNTTPGHPNCIAPGKRPRITLTPTMVLKDGAPVLAISVAGGDLQDQGDFEPIARLCGVWDAAGRSGCCAAALPRTTTRTRLTPIQCASRRLYRPARWLSIRLSIQRSATNLRGAAIKSKLATAPSPPRSCCGPTQVRTTRPAIRLRAVTRRG